MVQCLKKFEEIFPDIEDSADGGRFKNDLKNAFNDVMRATVDELHDYTVEYRPMRMGDDNILALTRTMMETVTKVAFGISHATGNFSCHIHAGLDKGKVLDAVRAEFDCGLLHEDDQGLVLSISGIRDCIKVIPIMDKYRLAVGVRDEYRVWRAAVTTAYCNGDRS
jgi:hypothetical protein